MNKTLSLSAFALVFAVAACDPKETKQEPAAAPQQQAQSQPQAKAQAPASYEAKFSTTKGDFVIKVERAWSPNGADRFYELVKTGYFDGAPFFRVVKGFMVQFGIAKEPASSAMWRESRIPDDPMGVKSNARGMVTFAMAGPNTRTTQIFINYGDNSNLDGMGFTPFGQVVSGMDVVDALNGEYGDGAPYGNGPSQERLQNEGAAYTRESFPRMDYVKTGKLK